MKMISIDDLIEYCDSERAAYRANNCGAACTALRRVVEFAKEYAVEAEPDNGWISVKDRLPEDDGKYMVWYKGECEICEFDTDSQTFGYTYDDYDEMYSHLVCWDDGIHKDVTHWRLLPEPPKGE